MPAKWKTSARFKPALVLDKINETRTINPEGGATYAGFGLHENLPVLQSMIEFPPAAGNVDTSTIVWAALGKVRESLTPNNLLGAINNELSDRLSTREEQYFLATSLSIDLTGLPKTFRHADVLVCHLPTVQGSYLKAHRQIISEHQVPVSPTPSHYQWFIANVKAKSIDSAFSKGMRAVDLQRALWCLMGNSSMSLDMGNPNLKPINVVRLGGAHTLHKPGGKSARDGLWFEPNFLPTKSYRFSNPAIVARNSRWALRRIQSCKYGDRISDSLVRFVRALDQADADSAFVRLWGALESLVTPEIGDYDALVRRCAFLYQDGKYHRQVLEHLREYRNMHLHGGVESTYARTHCFQLQMYFVEMIWFFLQNTSTFESVREVNDFLDQPADISILRKKLAHTKRALRFTSPK